MLKHGAKMSFLLMIVVLIFMILANAFAQGWQLEKSGDLKTDPHARSFQSIPERRGSPGLPTKGNLKNPPKALFIKEKKNEDFKNRDAGNNNDYGRERRD